MVCRFFCKEKENYRTTQAIILEFFSLYNYGEIYKLRIKLWG